jgi:predicted GNAT family N-acyltransferase
MVVREVLHKSDEYVRCVALRRDILRLPLGLDFSPAQLDAESDDFHLATFDGPVIRGCLVLSPINSSVIQMRQVAIQPEFQGRGLGRTLVEVSERFAKNREYSTMMLHARESAVPFYERLGYRAVGEPFEEVTIPHREMIKALG